MREVFQLPRHNHLIHILDVQEIVLANRHIVCTLNEDLRCTLELCLGKEDETILVVLKTVRFDGHTMV